MYSFCARAGDAADEKVEGERSGGGGGGSGGGGAVVEGDELL